MERKLRWRCWVFYSLK